MQLPSLPSSGSDFLGWKNVGFVFLNKEYIHKFAR